MFGFSKIVQKYKKHKYGKLNGRLFSLFFHDFRYGSAKRI